LFTGSAPLANEPDLFARHMVHAFVADPLRRPVCDARSDSSEAGLQRPLRQLSVRHFASARMS